MKAALLGSLLCCATLTMALPRGHRYPRRISSHDSFYRPSPYRSFQRPSRSLLYSSSRDQLDRPESYYPPQPYKFGYNTVDEYGTEMTRHEESDANNRKKGSYSFTDAHGITRRVDYVADEHGFRATINTNEPGTASSQPASALINTPHQPNLKAAASSRIPVVYTRNRPVYAPSAPSYDIAYGNHRSYRYF